MTESVKQETTTVTTTTTKKNASIITCSVPVIYTTGNISQRKWMKPIRDQNYLHRKDTFVCSLIELHYCSPVDLTPLTNKRHLVHFKLISSNDSNSSFSRKINDQLGFFFLPLFVSKFERHFNSSDQNLIWNLIRFVSKLIANVSACYCEPDQMKSPPLTNSFLINIRSKVQLIGPVS